jgi:hypothetical protein
MRYLRIGLAAALLCVLLPPPPACADEERPRALVADFVSSAGNLPALALRAATDTVAMELQARNVCEAVTRPEMERAARTRGLQAPYRDEDLRVLARDLGAAVVVTGEIRSVEERREGGRPAIEVGLIVRIRHVALDEMINGAAERGSALEPADGSKTRSALLMEAANSAGVRAVARIADYRPLTGTILNSEGSGLVVLNRGSSHGVKGKQEFVVFREGARVGRVRVYKLFAQFTEMRIVESAGGIQPQDRAIAVFPEPKFPPRR